MYEIVTETAQTSKLRSAGESLNCAENHTYMMRGRDCCECEGGFSNDVELIRGAKHAMVSSVLIVSTICKVRGVGWSAHVN